MLVLNAVSCALGSLERAISPTDGSFSSVGVINHPDKRIADTGLILVSGPRGMHSIMGSRGRRHGNRQGRHGGRNRELSFWSHCTYIQGSSLDSPLPPVNLHLMKIPPPTPISTINRGPSAHTSEPMGTFQSDLITRAYYFIP